MPTRPQAYLNLQQTPCNRQKKGTMATSTPFGGYRQFVLDLERKVLKKES
jgi:hypothetical protein